MADNLNELIALVYDASVSPSSWMAFLGALTQALGGTAAGLLHHRLDGVFSGSVAVSFDVDPLAVRLYGEHFGAIDPWAVRLRAAQQLDRDYVTTGEALLPMGAFRKTEYYSEFARSFDIVRCAAVGVATDPGISTSITVQRRERDAPFGSQETGLLAALQPHLRRSLTIYRRLSCAESQLALAEASLQRLPTGVVLLDRRSHVVFANREAQRIDTLNDGFTIFPVPRASSRAPQKRLTDALNVVFAGGTSVAALDATALSIPRPSLRPSYTLLLVPAPRPLNREAGALLFISDPDNARSSADIMMLLFGFTRAEARFAHCLTKGLTVQACAESLGITLHSARWFVRQLLEKTGTPNLAHLLRALLTSTASLYRSEHPQA
jgi:DNA-binding CsgD family transcriptional regulator